MDNQCLQHLIKAIFDSHADTVLDCESCSEQLCCLAEMVAGGADLQTIVPAVEEHLRTCDDCREEFEALLAIIRAENGGLVEAAS